MVTHYKRSDPIIKYSIDPEDPTKFSFLVPNREDRVSPGASSEGPVFNCNNDRVIQVSF